MKKEEEGGGAEAEIKVLMVLVLMHEVLLVPAPVVVLMGVRK